MLFLLHNNPIVLEHGRLTVDRKFHDGMQAWAGRLHAPVLSLHPQAASAQGIMDPVTLPLDTLGYEVMDLPVDAALRPLPGQEPRLRERIARQAGLVAGYGLGGIEAARALGVPYIMVLEYDLPTQIRVTASQVRHPLRRAVRAARTAWRHLRRDVPDMRAALALHCNGYPVHEATRGVNAQRLLYLDSRMSRDLVIDEAVLRARLAERRTRPLRLLYSGRYEPMKGALDAVQAALGAIALGVDLEMHCHGQGSLADAMRQRVREAGQQARVHVHDALPYPELVLRARECDLFVCCHVQGDPSCTYVESFGGGLPVVGYGNAMWRRLCETSGAGLSTPVGRPGEVARAIQALARDAARLDALSLQARRFALAHSSETAFDLRTQALNEALDSAPVRARRARLAAGG